MSNDRATGWDIFEHGDPHTTGYKFIMPGVAIVARDLDHRYINGKWVVAQQELGHHYIAEGDSDLDCVLSLIKQRLEGHECNEHCTRRSE